MLRFTVLESHGRHLEVLNKYAAGMWKMSNGRVGGEISQENLLKAHEDSRLNAVDGAQSLPEKFLVVKTGS